MLIRITTWVGLFTITTHYIAAHCEKNEIYIGGHNNRITDSRPLLLLSRIDFLYIYEGKII